MNTNRNVTLSFDEARVLYEALMLAETFFEARDEMNGAVHDAYRRLSPITEKVMAAKQIAVAIFEATKP